MRGQRSLFSDKFFVETVKKDKQRPRNYFMPERDRALLHRYYFHAELNKLRYDTCLEELEKEFFLTSFTIVKILTKHTNDIDVIIEKPPTLSDLKKQYPWLTWKTIR